MRKAYMKMDGWIISALQDTYLWLLDRTGVYVATVSFATYTVVAGLNIAQGAFPTWAWIVLLAFVGLSSGHKYLMQDKGKNESLNFSAMRMEEWRWRHSINIALFCFLIIALLALDVVEIIEQLGFLLFGYCFLIKVRDRDKKPLFKKAPQMAIQHGSN